jgi:cytoskeletal protein CcmA (bactofilin family)
MEGKMDNPATVVGANTRINGNLEGDEDLIVIGRMDGNLSLAKSLTVDPAGVVVADIHAESAIIHGTVVGNITATEVVQITEEGRVVGDLHAPRVVIEDGAAFRGSVQMGASDVAWSSKPVARASRKEEPKDDEEASPAPTPPPPPRRVVQRSQPPPKRTRSSRGARGGQAKAQAVDAKEPVEPKPKPKPSKKKPPRPPTTAGRKTRARRR